MKIGNTIAIVVVMIVCFLLGKFSGNSTVEYKPYTIKIKNDSLIYVDRIDTLPQDTIHDTTYITRDTPIGEIPIRYFSQTQDLSILVNNRPLNIPLTANCSYRGILYKLNIKPERLDYILTPEGQKRRSGLVIGGLSIVFVAGLVYLLVR